jgi:isoleucyl-tRNA synthetase
MEGFDAPYIPGWDCHGLPIEHQVEKKLGSKRREITQKEFRNLCREYAKEQIELQKKIFYAWEYLETGKTDMHHWIKVLREKRLMVLQEYFIMAI